MSEDTTITNFDGSEVTDNSLMRTFTQIASCAVGERRLERQKRSLRAKLERERLEREQDRLDGIFSRSFRNLFKGF